MTNLEKINYLLRRGVITLEQVAPEYREIVEEIGETQQQPILDE